MNVALVIGAVLCGATVVSYRRSARNVASWKKAAGTVIEIKREQRPDMDDDLQWMSASVVRFTAQGRGSFTFQDPVWSSHPVHTVGRQVQVLYDPVDPSAAVIAGWRPYFLTIGFAIATAVFLLIAVAEA